MIAEELEKMKLDVEQEKAEILVRLANKKTYTPQEGADLEIQLAQLKAEKAVVTFQVENQTVLWIK